jgi:hypothetical protein
MADHTLLRFDLFLGNLHVMEYPSGRYLEGDEERQALEQLSRHPAVEAATLRNNNG